MLLATFFLFWCLFHSSFAFSLNLLQSCYHHHICITFCFLPPHSAQGIVSIILFLCHHLACMSALDAFLPLFSFFFSFFFFVALHCIALIIILLSSSRFRLILLLFLVAWCTDVTHSPLHFHGYSLPDAVTPHGWYRLLVSAAICMHGMIRLA